MLEAAILVGHRAFWPIEFGRLRSAGKRLGDWSGVFLQPFVARSCSLSRGYFGIDRLTLFWGRCNQMRGLMRRPGSSLERQFK